MNRITTPFARLALTGATFLLALGCSTAANQTGTPGTGTGDVATLDSAGLDTGAGADSTTGTDATATDTTPGNDATQTADVGDTTGDVTTLTDVQGDVKGDTATGDAKTDAKTDAKDATDVVAPSKCLTNADCKSVGFGDCLSVACNVGTGKCELLPEKDGKVCAVKGTCGGAGVCKQGACNFNNSCGSQACVAQAVKCGDKLTLSVGSFGPSVLSKYNCSQAIWDGGEKVLTLAGDATQAVVATVTLTDDVSPTAVLLDIGNASNVCNPGVCDVTGTKLVLGVPVGVARTIVVDTLKADAGNVTVTIECKPLTKCGDGECNGTESSANCPKDCGESLACGDGKCDAKTENCNGCPEDCGVCPAPCPAKKDPKCPSNPCESCVCAQDSFCCDTSWDSNCVDECTSCGGSACGDNKCDGDEDSTSCPNDCPKSGFCGDGECNASSDPANPGETCKDCPQDCGTCSGAGPTCGDGKCDPNEQCATCPQDCGQCDKICADVCDPIVCAMDSFCCTKFDSLCDKECADTGKPPKGKAICPVDKCGDGVCSGAEKCDACTKDCGTCPAVCGNGKCESGETLSNCKADCTLGCEGKCDSSSKDANGDTCWCDSFCTENGDCCDDKVQFCK